MARGPPSCFGPGEGGGFRKGRRGNVELAEVTASCPVRGEASTVEGPQAGRAAWVAVYGGRGGRGASVPFPLCFLESPFVCFFLLLLLLFVVCFFVHRMSLLYVGER